MNYAWIPLTAAMLSVACIPDSKDGGSVLETDGNSVETAAQTTGPAASSGAAQTSAGTGEGSTTAEGSSTAEESSTGGGIPSACAERGWDTSYQAWQNAVAEADGQYSYVSETQSYDGKTELACVYNTTIRVADGVVVERAFTLIESLEDADCEDDFTEVGDELGESDVPFAADAVGLDQVYIDCCNNHLDVPEEDFFIVFDVDDAGLLQRCGAQYSSCGESCELEEPGLINIVSHEFGA